jgi:UDPglucose 6-dehydrogenase
LTTWHQMCYGIFLMRNPAGQIPNPTLPSRPQLKVAVIGTGYVGLTTGAYFAHLGHKVICADILPARVEALRQGQIPILEKDLPELVAAGTSSGNLTFVLGALNAVEDCDFAFMCLPTPQGADGSADLSYLLAAAKEIAASLPSGAIVVNKSTVPVGSAQLVAETIARNDIFVASNPEFLREGTAVSDSFKPDRIIIGAELQATRRKIAELYEAIDAPKLLVDTTTAELIKYASNAYLASKISFANSIANLCEAVGANAHEVLKGMGHDSRIGKKFLQPGPGWGGSCFPKDVFALINIAETAGYDFDLLKAVIASNDTQLELMVQKVAELLRGQIDGSKIAVWGLTFKAGTDDTRESPSLKIINRLVELGASVQAYDPATRKPLPGVVHAPTALSACNDADLLLVLTEWPEFSEVSLKKVASRLKSLRVLDTRNVISTQKLTSAGFDFHSVGYAPNYKVDQFAEIINPHID